MALFESLGYKQESPQRRNDAFMHSQNQNTSSEFAPSQQQHQQQPQHQQSFSHSQFPAAKGNGYLANHAYLRHRGNSSSSTHNNGSSFAMHNSMSGSINVHSEPESNAASFYSSSMAAYTAGGASSPPKQPKAIRASPVVPMPQSASAGLSPIRGGAGNGHSHAHNNSNLTLPLNVSHAAQFANDTRLTQFVGVPSASAAANGAVNVNQTQIAIIGFPTGEAAYIHRKFRAYGTVLRSEWKSNTLFIEYENAQNGQRALAENAKWIDHENQRYMIAVIYADNAQGNLLSVNEQQESQTNKGGRFINYNEMYNNSFKNILDCITITTLNVPPPFSLAPNTFFGKYFILSRLDGETETEAAQNAYAFSLATCAIAARFALRWFWRSDRELNFGHGLRGR